jgi:hypothetical protein
MVFAGCSLLWAGEGVVPDHRPRLGAGFRRPIAGRTVGAAIGRDTNPFPCWMFIAAEVGSAREISSPGKLK